MFLDEGKMISDGSSNYALRILIWKKYIKRKLFNPGDLNGLVEAKLKAQKTEVWQVY